MQLFYNPELDRNSEYCSFSKSESGHLFKVLRKKQGDQLQVTNGKGACFMVELTEVGKYSSVGKILRYEQEKEKVYKMHLAVAPTKKNARFENFLEKATEIGIDEITPIFCKNSERRTIKYDRFERILEAAMKQSLRWSLPQLNRAEKIEDFFTGAEADQKFIAHCEKQGQKTLKDLIEPEKKVLITIGPEGDFSSSEIELAQKFDFQAVTLGDYRLRTETAAMVSCHTVALANMS